MNLLYINWDVDPEIINILGFSIKYYGLLFMTGLLLCYFILRKIYKNENLSSQAHEAIIVYGIVGILLGARLGHCLFYDFEYYSKNPLEILLPIQKGSDGSYHFAGIAGLASHGGTVGLIIAMMLYSKKYSIRLLKIFDLIAIVAPLGGAFIRLSNLMNSEMIGVPTNLPWAFIFKRVDGIPRHPAQLYEAISYFIIFFILLLLYRRHTVKIGNGFYFGLSIFLIFTMRILIEFLKIDQVEFEKGMVLNMGQILSIPFIILGLFFTLKGWMRKHTI